MEQLLSVRNLGIAFATQRGEIPVVEGLSFDIAEGELLGLVGESGSGKSATAYAIMRLLEYSGARTISGEVRFLGRDLLTLSQREMRAVRGQEIAMVFQEPMTSLNPLKSIGAQIAEVLHAHGLDDRAEARRRAVAALDQVGIPDPGRRYASFPHELSGGMRQRAMIAMALVCGPKLLIADEPTTALDVTIQAQILDLIAGLRRDLGMAVLLITHDLGVVADVADRVAVLYAGRLAECASADAIFATPLHPYTGALLRSMPDIGDAVERLPAIPGVVPHSAEMPGGCRFHPRCASAFAPCKSRVPREVLVDSTRVACHLHGANLHGTP